MIFAHLLKKSCLWYNLELLRDSLRSSYFGLRCPQNVLRKLLWLAIAFQFKNPGHLLFSGSVNSALKFDEEVTSSLMSLCHLSLAPHTDRAKNWDAFRVFSFILKHGFKNATVLDMGCATYGVILKWLHLYGLRNLHGCDISLTYAFQRGSIRYTSQNIERTTYPAARFDSVTCLSVIEHGVDLDCFFREASRILKTGGYLLISTDYWRDRLLTDVRYDALYDCRIKVFSHEDILMLLNTASQYGFRPVEEIDDACHEKVVYWERMGLHFTFLVLVLRLG